MLALALSWIMRRAHRLRVFAWRRMKRPAFGVHAVPVTPDGRIVLVRLTYASGWHVPGGARKRRELPRDGALRELKEEIGLRSHGGMALVEERDGMVWGRPHRGALFLVREAIHRPRWSLEIAEVATFDPAALPGDLSPVAARMVAAALAYGRSGRWSPPEQNRP